MGTTQAVFLGRPGLEYRFAVAVLQGDLPDHDYYVPVLSLNRKGELVDMARKEGYDLIQRDTLEFLQGLSAEDRWASACRRIYRFLAEDCVYTLDLLENRVHMPVDMDDSAPFPDNLTERSGTGKLSPTRASWLINRALERGEGKDSLPAWQIGRAQDLSNCLLHMSDCFCTLYPNDYTVSGYVLPGERVSVRDEDAVMFVVDIHR
jgi:hypothetical protein